MQIQRVLIANRGEIALRVLRACRELGIEVVAAFTKADRELRHLDLADDAVCIGETSYLDPAAMVAAASSRGCDAIHPGYGLLSENPAFAQMVRDAGLVFIGPSAETMTLMGDKRAARDKVESLGLEVIPGIAAAGSDVEAWANDAGFPMLVKAAHGGGGRGMRLVTRVESLASAIEAARSESAASFGSDEVYLERYLDRSRHVEVQVFGDGRGHAVHFGTRDCSVQRSYQKLIEEAPAPAIASEALDALAARCVEVAAALSYSGAGTFEFLYADDRFFFIEMNTRLQVEHPVTEMVTGHDLVQLQLRVAAGGALPRQEEILFTGHAIECRVNAESTTEGGETRPSPGRITELVLPGGPGVRVDSHLYAGYTVPHQYDSLIAKIVAFGRDRAAARAVMERALVETVIRGVETNRERLIAVVRSREFAEADPAAIDYQQMALR